MRVYLSTLIVFLLSPVAVFASDVAWPGDAGAIISGTSELGAGYEPSGIVSLDDGSLVLVGDDGDVSVLQANGTIVSSWSPGGDLEGVTTIDSGDYVYIGVEHPDAIKQFSLSAGVFTGKSWDLTTWMTGASNQGLEALTFVPNGVHPYANGTAGGLFYAGLQADGDVYVFNVDLTTSDSVTLIATLDLGTATDISGLHYEEETETVFAIFDGVNRLVEFSPSGIVQNSYELPGNDQEGITMIPVCGSDVAGVYIAEDVGPEVWMYGSYSMTCIVDEVPGDDLPVEDPGDDTGDDLDPDDSGLGGGVGEVSGPGKLTKLSIQKRGKRKYKFRWKGNASFYRVALLSKKKNRITLFDRVTNKRKTIGKNYIKQNRSYYIRVRPCNSSGCSGSRIKGFVVK